MKILNKKDLSLLRNAPSWPQNPEKSDCLFMQRAPYRKLILMIDDRLVYRSRPAQTIKLSPKLILSGLLTHPYIDCYRYRTNGPPKTIQCEKIGFDNKKVYEGWVTAFPNEKDFTMTEVRSAKDGKYHLSYCENNFSYHLNKQVFNKELLPFDIAIDALRADIYVTDRQDLLQGRPYIDKNGTTICSVNEALSLIGLYLRSQGEFVLCAWSDFTHSFNKGLFYWVGMRELLPKAWKWFSACVKYSHLSGDEYLLQTGGSVLSRMSRVLQYRDFIYITLNLPTNNDSNDDALSYLDSILFLLMGSLDAMARVLNYVLNTGIEDENVGWQKTKWIQFVKKDCPKIAVMFEEGTRYYNILTILRLLRNSVHGAALQGITVLKDNKKEMYIGLFLKEQQRILKAVDELGYREILGIEEIYKGRVIIDPIRFTDTIIKEVFPLLNKIMEKTPLKNLKGLDISMLESTPPTPQKNGRNFEFSEYARKSIRWQLGF